MYYLTRIKILCRSINILYCPLTFKMLCILQCIEFDKFVARSDLIYSYWVVWTAVFAYLAEKVRAAYALRQFLLLETEIVHGRKNHADHDSFKVIGSEPQPGKRYARCDHPLH